MEVNDIVVNRQSSKEIVVYLDTNVRMRVYVAKSEKRVYRTAMKAFKITHPYIDHY